MRSSTAIALIIFVAGCSEPFGFIPGGALTGDVVDPPDDWSELEHIKKVQLEFRPGNPYSINTWAVGIGPDAYIATREDGTRWTDYLRDTPEVRVRVETSIYELIAVRLLDDEEHRTVSEAFVAKYGIDEDDNWVAKGQVFRLDRRQAREH